MRQAVGCAIVLIATSVTAFAAAPELIGSWVLSCPDQASCILRAKDRLFSRGSISADLEVQARGKFLLPVIALRGVPDEALMAASLAGQPGASVQYAGGFRADLTCAAAVGMYVCSPKDDGLSADLPTARSVTVRLSISIPGMKSLPEQKRTIALADTSAALARLRILGPTRVPGPMTPFTTPSRSWLTEMANEALKRYPNSVAQLQALLAKYLKK